MIAVLQRVSMARVVVDGQTVGEIGPGLLVLVCAEQDTAAEGDKLLAKILKLRIFSDAQGKMNLSVQDMDGAGTVGGLLIVSQFTLAADVRGGNRPSFTAAAAPMRDAACTTCSWSRPVAHTLSCGPASLPRTCRSRW